jgi:pimeloyl-ACP methyl ester carboxylesterase
MGVTLNGIELEWRERGDGDVVVFIHGFPFNSAMWGHQLAAMPPDFRGLAPDLRGFGASDLGSEPVLTMELLARDIAGLLDHLGIERVVLCGLSMGGYVAFEFWRQFADRVRALVLCDTRAAADSGDTQRARKVLADRVRSEGPGPVIEALLPKLLSPSTARKREKGVAPMVRAMMEETPPETMARALLGMADRADAEALLRTIDIPVLVVVGSDDVITSRGQAEMLARGIRGARLELIESAGHMAPLEQPEEFNAVLSQFLVGLPRNSLSTRSAFGL